MKLLLVEDDPILGRSLQVSLELQGYQVEWVTDVRSAEKSNSQGSLSLVILDLGLPDKSGFEFLKELRAAKSRIPVIIVSAQSDEESVVKGLELGANDFVKKPFGQRELMARIKSTLREPLRREDQLRYGELLILLGQRKMMISDVALDISRREFDILLHLVEHAELIVTRENLLASLDKDGEIFDRTIDSHVSHIRSKLKKAGAQSIKVSSVYGIGYRLEKA